MRQFIGGDRDIGGDDASKGIFVQGIEKTVQMATFFPDDDAGSDVDCESKDDCKPGECQPSKLKM